ncbi:uncharacterized protein N7479_002447 [Penicillium vulpinum]|uniref:uncharacterized protein n=1 Tax=Penicillium vulpinum TaxID=29845 RepID=UPI0025481F76|nr:uncharacterized protein N7479_002447 [Penicillium vulpinum]KAJ5972529.1 hypothetical protein N7479_002447 [Penicillium vulpinum]
MKNVKVIGPTGLAPISREKQADVRITTEVIYDVITKCKMISLEESIHAPVDVRNKAQTDRLKALAARLNSAHTQMGVPNDVGKKKTASTGVAQDKSSIDPRAKPFVPATAESARPHCEVADYIPAKDIASKDIAAKSIAVKNKSPAGALAKDTTAPKKAKVAGTGTPTKAAGSKDAGSTAGSKASHKSESIVDEESSGSSKKPRGVTAPADFMKQVRKLQLKKQAAAKVVPPGPPRRIVFGNLPDWANISSILHLVYGGAIERAWSEDDEIIVQFVEQDDCVKYYENHSDGITLKDGDDELTISVTMPEEGLQDNAELLKRVDEGASRVVCLSGLPAGFRSSDNEAILGIGANPAWNGKSFDHILIKQAESGVDVYIFFYDLHEGWDFLQSIKEGAYDCIASFEVDSCARAQGFHFVDEPNPMLSGMIAMD